MTCRNSTNEVIVSFIKSGKAISGKIEYIPMELMVQWAMEPQGDKRFKKVVLEAEENFLRAYFEDDIKRNGIRKDRLVL
jgi:hypothetical protein